MESKNAKTKTDISDNRYERKYGVIEKVNEMLNSESHMEDPQKLFKQFSLIGLILGIYNEILKHEDKLSVQDQENLLKIIQYLTENPVQTKQVLDSLDRKLL